MAVAETPTSHFIPSPQTTGWNGLATMADVVAAYRIFLHREGEERGLRHHAKYVAEGMPLERLADIFITSAEHCRLQKSDLVTIDLGGYFVCVDPKETDIGRWIVYHEDYEPHVRRAISERLGPAQTFVDLGANVGCLSFHAATIVGPSGRVVSVEPNPTNLQRLYAGIVSNGFTNVRVMPYAVSDRRTTFSLAGGTSNTYVTYALDVDKKGTYVQSMIPDEDLAYLPSIDLIKMDVEGHESFALRGFDALIRKHDPTLLVEFCPFSHWETGNDPMEFLNILFRLYKRATATTLYGDSAEFGEPDGLMAYWRKRNVELSDAGIIPEGVLHLDLIATNR
jgi:FkbM family methyltransferase